jgi:four helix bundle protein
MNKPRDIEGRVFALALATIRWGRRKPTAWIDRDLVRQMVRATTSVGANLEEARAAETKKDFIHKASVARKEALEAHYWARLLLADTSDDVLARLAGELNEVAAILTTIVKRSRQSARRGSPHQPPE